MIDTVVFDVGETLVNESRFWEWWSEQLGVSRLTFLATLGAVIERGEHHRRVFEILAPGLDIYSFDWPRLDQTDLYPDAVPVITRLDAAGYRVGVVGNQPEATEAFFAGLGLPLDVVASSASWGVTKPDPEFFENVVAAAGASPDAIAYVGDRIDNDVGPAQAAGMTGVWLVRGPWAVIQQNQGWSADVTIHSLDELPAALPK